MIVFKLNNSSVVAKVFSQKLCDMAMKKGELVKCEFGGVVYYAYLHFNYLYIDFGEMVLRVNLLDCNTTTKKEE